MRDKLFIVLRDNKMIVKVNNEDKLIEYHFNTLTSYPNIPFYVNIFELGSIFKEIKCEVLSKIRSNVKRFLKPEIFVLIDDDAMGIEKRAIIEFISITFSPKETFLVEQSAVLSPFDTKEYISISKTCRLFVVSYIKDRKVIAQKFIDNKELLVDELKELIKELHNDCRYKKMEIFLNGIHLKNYTEIGQLVEINELLTNAQKILMNV
ncbi:hypothetical protein [Oceanirhabdus sp. W0125-5]|uniref:hypothetical protein n=1 Tax=Oceanirhabdus sp. W0125-5 TaxID=2999116 RepID=UPI0022F2DFCA|nr:hypothetical protein [Oceanirhabdus sp. W0125-5]WBW95066.1 hypothetical protein OW730_15375 [Oceanirhabdus sp. W0125-5]